MSTDPIFIDFRKINNLNALSKYIGAPEKLVNDLINEQTAPAFFIQHEIPKKGRGYGTYRTVWEPQKQVKNIYKSLARRFDLFLRRTLEGYPSAFSYGYTRGKSTLENAQQHIGTSLILHADIENFFQSISKDRIQLILKYVGLNDYASETLSTFLTLNGVLPLGLPTSPLIANLCCMGLDKKLALLSDKYNCNYSRYADDISISGNSLPTKIEVVDILRDEGFNLSENKFRITKNGQAHFVTGLSVSDKIMPHVPKRMKRRLRQELHYCEKFGLQNHLIKETHDISRIQNEINRLDGMVRYVSHIEKRIGPEIKSQWEKILRDNNAAPSYESMKIKPSLPYSIYVDEMEFTHDGQKYLAIGFGQTSSHDIIEGETLRVLDGYMDNPFSSGDMSSLEKRKLHFTDATEDLRKEYIDLMPSLPFDGYIAFKLLPDESAYKTVYLDLTKELLPNRLRGLDRAEVTLLFEQNSKISASEIKAQAESIWDELYKQNDRVPESIETRIVSKNECYGVSVPDFLLALLKRYISAKLDQKPTPRDVLLFELVRDKIRVIYDADNSIWYTRKRPFKSVTPE